MNDTLDQHASSQHGLVPRPYRTLERYVSRFELPQPMATDTGMSHEDRHSEDL